MNASMLNQTLVLGQSVGASSGEHGAGILTIILMTAALMFGVTAVVFIIAALMKGLAWTFRRVGEFLGKMLQDSARLIGTTITWVVMMCLCLGNLCIGRWSAARHFGRAMNAEVGAFVGALFRLCFGHWLWLIGLKEVTEGLERRVPQAIAAAPGATDAGVASVNHAASPPPRIRNDEYAPAASPAAVVLQDAETSDVAPVAADQGAREQASVYAGARSGVTHAGKFDGYSIIGTLPGGGSGGKLYIARPDALKLASFERQGFSQVGDVVIKAFSVREGSSLPQIVRESRALEAAKKLGLVLEHQLTPERFFYAMRYVPGDSLSIVTQRLHASSEPGGLSGKHLRLAVSYATDLVATLDHYHCAGLWHKDIKPDNIIVNSQDGRAHLVDFGLLTPLRSSMTLTTHGTEYFRDPEMVRMALRGVKVGDVDGGKFDVYGAGAVLYSVLENSFPAHGALSQITRRCPEPLRWIVRRAMTDYDKRYATSGEMLQDLRAVLTANDPMTMRVAELPSVRAGGETGDAGQAAAVAAPAAVEAPGGGVGAVGLPGGGVAFLGPKVGEAGARPRPSGSAAEQLARARERVRVRRERARSRLGKRGAKAGTQSEARMSALNGGTVAAGAVGVMFVVMFFSMFFLRGGRAEIGVTAGGSSKENSAAPAKPRPAAPLVVIDGETTVPDPNRATGTRSGNRRNSNNSTAATPETPAKVDGARVLVWRSTTVAGGEELSIVRHQIEQLRARGFDVLAEQDWMPDGLLVDADQFNDLAGGASAAIGAASPGESRATAALQAWMRVVSAKGNERIHAVVWFNRSTDGKNKLRAWLVIADGPDAAMVRAAARGALLTPIPAASPVNDADASGSSDRPAMPTPPSTPSQPVPQGSGPTTPGSGR